MSRKYIKSDFYRYTGEVNFRVRRFILLYLLESGFAFMFWFRLCKSKNRFISLIAKINLFRLRKKYNLHISSKCRIGYGFYIGHGCNVFIAPTAKIGNNVSVHQCVTIGSNENRAASIGDNVYIAPHVCITNKVIIGSNVVIGAGSVVTKDLMENSICVGSPAEKIRDNLELYPRILNPYLVE